MSRGAFHLHTELMCGDPLSLPFRSINLDADAVLRSKIDQVMAGNSIRRQVQALGNEGDFLFVFASGRLAAKNQIVRRIVAGIDQAYHQGVNVVFVGGDVKPSKALISKMSAIITFDGCQDGDIEVAHKRFISELVGLIRELHVEE